MKHLIVILLVLLTACAPWQFNAPAPTPTAAPSLQSLVNSTAEGATITLTQDYSGDTEIVKSIVINANGHHLLGCLLIEASGTIVNNLYVDANYEATSICDGYGVYIAGSGVWFYGGTVTNASFGGIDVVANTTFPMMSNADEIADNDIYNVGLIGIDYRGSNGIIDGNHIHHILEEPSWLPKSAIPSYEDSDCLHYHNAGNTITNNICEDFGYQGANCSNSNCHPDCMQTFSSAPSQLPASNTLIKGNTCNVYAASLPSGLSMKCWQIANAAGVTITGNTCILNELAAINNGSSNVTIEGNTFYAQTHDGESLQVINGGTNPIGQNTWYPISAYQTAIPITASPSQTVTPSATWTPSPTITPVSTATATPSPTIAPTQLTPIPPTVTPTPAPVNNCPYSAPYFARVLPLPFNSNAFQIYIPGGVHANTGFPATLFLQRILDVNSWTHDTEYIALSQSWLTAMAALNDGEWGYLHASFDGTFFNGNKLGVDTFPDNILQVIGRKYRKGECWDEIATAAYTANNSSILTTLPPYELGHQTNMTYNTYPAVTVNGDEYIPLLYKGDSANGGLWLEDLYLSPATGSQYYVTATSGLHLRSGPSLTDSVIETMPYQSIVTELGISNDGQWMEVTAADGKSGWASMEYLAAQ